MLLGPHCIPFGEFLVSLWGTLGSLGTHFGPPGAALGRPGSTLELLWDNSGPHWEKKCHAGHPLRAEASQVPCLRAKTSLLEFARRSWRSWRNGPGTTVQDLPSTRAGDQDDVSLKQTPSNEYAHWLPGSLRVK